MKIKLLIAGILILGSLAFQVSPYARRIRPFISTPSSCQENEIGYNMTSHALVICTNAGYTTLATGASGSFAPSNATYITQTANGTLTNEQALSALATGILKNTITTGVLSIASAGTDYENPLTFNSPLSRSINTISCSTCALTSGNLSQFASTTSAQLAGVLSDESGSGSLLFATLSSLTTNDVLTWNGSNWINQAVSGGGSLGTGNINMTVANASSVGTTTGLLAKLTGAPSTVRNAQTTDTENAIGICTSGCGTTGNATIAIAGQVNCQFDGSTTAGDYVVISATSAGKCADSGSTFPTDKAAYGRVLTTNVGAGTYAMTLMTPDIAFQNAGNGKSRPGGATTQVQYNNAGAFAGNSNFTFDNTGVTKLFVPGGDATHVGLGIGSSSQGFSIITSGTTGVGFLTGNAHTLTIANGIQLKSNGGFFWTSSNDPNGTVDTALLRDSAGRVKVEDGSGSHNPKDLIVRQYLTQTDSAPTVSSGFGTSPAITSGSTNSAGQIDVGTGGVATSGVINFNTSWPNPPFCIAQDQTTAILQRATATSTQLTITSASVWIANDKINWHCIGPR